MKKTMITFLMITIMAGAVFAQTGTIRELTGEVEVKALGAQDFTPARAGMEVAQSTIISTGFRSTAVVAVGSNTITVRPLTRLSLAEIQASSDSENLNVNLQTGRIRVEVNPPAGTRASTSVQTPTATASVRGTDWDMDTHNFTVNEGRVYISNKKGFGSLFGKGGSTTITDNDIPNSRNSYRNTLAPDLTSGQGASGEKTGTDPRNTVDVYFILDW